MKIKRLPSGLVISVLFASASSLVPAATFTSVAAGDWGVAANWDVGVGTPNPYAGDSAIINATINYDGSQNPALGGVLVVANGNSITVGAGGALTQTFVGAGPFGSTIAIGVSHPLDGAGTLNIEGGGSFTSGTANTVVVGVGVAALGPNPGAGVVNIKQGTMTLSASASGSAGGQGLAVGINSGATGAINVGDGAGAADSSLLDLATNNVTLTVGGTQGGGAGSGTGTVTVKSDGRINAGTANINVGESGGNGTLKVNGGTLSGGTGEINLSGTSLFEVTAGAVSTTGDLNVGRNAGTNGTANFSGGTASFAGINVGRAGGTGTLNVTGGGLTSTGEFNVGRDAGTNGTATLSGGTVSSGNLRVGRDGGTGSMTISGATVGSSDFVRIGTDNGIGTLSISSGALNSTNYLTVGQDGGVGTVNQTGGTVTFSQWAAIGVGGGAGTSQWDVSGGNVTSTGGAGFEVGSDRQGTMNISGTANVSVGAFSLGIRANGIGFVNKTGGTLTTNNLGIAGAQAGNAQGTFNLSGGTTTIVGGGGQSFVGNRGGSTGTLNVSNGAVLDNTSGQDWQIGFNGGVGNVNVTGGGKMNHNWWFNIARGAGSNGNVSVDGLGSEIKISTGQTNVGEDGTGSLAIRNGGSFLAANEDFSLARNNGSNGTVVIESGGTLASSAPTLGGGGVHIGRADGATGTMTVTGAGSVFNSRAQEFRIASSNTSVGTLNIVDGGVVNFRSTNGAGDYANGNFGLAENGTGVATINMDNGTLNITAWSMFSAWNGAGTNATLNMNNSTVNLLSNGGDAGHLFWGDSGTSTINQEGGLINAQGWSAIGRERGGNATYNLGMANGGGAMTIGGTGGGGFYVGRQSHGTINMGPGTSITNTGEFNIGQETSPTTPSSGTVNNGGGIVTVGDEFNIGRNGIGTTGVYTQTAGQLITHKNNNEGNWVGRDGTQGTLNLLGGTAQLDGALNIGAGGGGSNGTVNIANATMNVNGWLTMGRDTGGSATTSTLNIGAGGVYNHAVGIGGDALVGWQNGSTATINVTEGGQMNYAWWFRVAVDPGSTGTVNIDGAGSKITQNSAGGGRIMIGESGTGSMNVTNGGVYQVINGDQFQVGGNTDGNGNTGRGTLNISGAGSLVTTNNYFRAGAGSNASGRAEGVVNITNGGKLSTGQWGGVGHDGGNGTLNMEDGILQIGTDWHVGIDTNGRPLASLGVMNVNGASTVTTGASFIVGRNGGNGTVTNNGGTVGIGVDLDLGRDGVGVYTNAAGVTNVGRHANIGHGANGNGTVNVIGGTMNVAANLDVANGGGDATVNVDGGATLNAQDFYLGTNAGSIGTVNVTNGTFNLNAWSEIGRFGGQGTVNIAGANARFDGSSSDMQIGHQGGTGFVNVTDGGTFVHNWWVNIGRDGGTGNMVVDGVGSKVTLTRRSDGNNDARFNIGGDPNGSTNNTGTLTISNGGLVERTSDGGEVNVGRGAGSTGTLNITDGGRFTNVGANTFVGLNSGTGTMNISSGGQFTSGFGEFNVGLNGAGTVNITGAGSKILVSTRGDDNFHRVGQSAGGVGSMNITDGGEWQNNGWFTISEAGSTGTVTVDGAGSKLTTTNGLIVGWSGAGTGTLTVSNNGVVNSTGREVSIGRDFNANLASSPKGIVNLVDGGTLNGINLRIGHGATGTVNIDGGKLNSTGGWAIVADGANSLGTINMSSGSINTTDSMFVGMQGTANGTINQQGGSTNIGNEFMLGRAGATGTLNLSGGTFNVNGWTVVGGGRDGGAGTGTINVTNGAKYTHLQTGGDLLNGWQSGSTGSININSGGSMAYNWWVRMGVDAGSTGNLTVDGAGSVFEQGTVGGDTRFLVGEGGTGNLNVLNDGLVKVRNGLGFGGSFDENKTGTGTLNLDGGHVKVGGEINFGIKPGATGNANVNGGTMTNNSWFIVGRAGTGVYSQTGGRVWNTSQELRVGNDAGGSGTMTVSGGTFNSFSHGMVGESGAGVINLTGGILGIGCCTGGNLYIGHLNGSSGTVNVAGGLLDVGGAVEFNTQGGATTATLNLISGILATDFINDPTASTTGRLNGVGGTLKATKNESDFIRGMSSTQLVLDGAGLTLDTNNFTVTLNSVFSGAGDFTKSGFGTLNLTANQLSTGSTGVTSGVLNLDFTASAAPTDLVANSGLVLGGGTLRVNTSATLASTQNFTGTTINSGSSRVEILDNGGTGAINLGEITRNAGGTVDVGVVGTISTTSANVNGILGKGLTVNGNDWAKNDGTGKIVAAVPADYAATFGATNNLDVTAAITGGGAVNSIKASANITLDANTTVGSGGILIPTTAGNVTIASTAGETLTSGNGLDLVVIQNSLTGTATIGSKITGAIALTKSGNGTLVLGNTANDYTGGTFINAGAVVIGSDSALGNVNGGLTFAAQSISSGGVLAVTETMTLAATRAVTINSGGGGFNVPATKTLTINQDITGAGSLGKFGAGTLVLGGINTYTGDTAIFEGSLTMNGSIAAAGGFIADGNVTLNAGGSISTAGAVQIARNAGPSVLVTGADATISGGEFTIGGAGSATVTLTGASTLAASCDLFVARQNGSTSALTVTNGSVIAQQAMIIGAAGGANGTATVTDGTLSVGTGLYVGSGGGTGVLNLTGTTNGSFGFLEVGSGATGTLNIVDGATLKGSTAGNNGYINVGNSNPGVAGSAVVNQSGGEVTFNSWMTIGIASGSNDPANSQYNISGGKLTSPAGIELGSDHGGTLNVSGTANVAVGVINLGQYGERGHGTAGNGLLNVSGGTVAVNEMNVGTNANNGGLTSNGVANFTGGLTTVNGTLWVARNGGGGGSTGTVNLDGGELKVTTISRGAGSAAQLNFNGTVIKPNAASGNFITGFDTTSVDVKAGGAIFNTDGKNIGVSTSLDGVGALTKAGNGQLQLSGDSSYAGGVNLNAGTLSVRHNNALGTGTLIGNGGILSFDNSTGAGLIEGRLAGAFNTADAIPFDAVRLGTPKANETNPGVFGDNTTWGYRGSLVVPAGPDVTWTFSKQFDDSMRLLIDGNQLINDGTWNAAVVATVTLTPGEHTLEIRAGQGGGGVGPNNGWTVGFGIDTLGRNTADPSFFTPLTDPGDGSRLKYNDGGTAEYTVANAATLNVATEIYVRQFGATMTGNIAGVGGINKTGNGRLTLAGTNSYSGTTNIAAGVLEVGNGGATGSLGSGNVTNAGTLKFNRTGTLNVPGNISGTGPVEQNGAGTTVLAGTNTYTGATTVNAGNLQVTGSISGSVVGVTTTGTLSGSGTVGVVNTAGTIAPGVAAGILNTGNITFTGGALSLEINGTTVGSLYDQLNTTGAVTLQSNVALALNFGFGVTGGETFTIINNDGTDAIGGAGLLTFASVPLNDGDLFSDFGNGLSLQIDYNGGTNSNDVVLTVVPEPGSLVMVMGGLAILAGVRRRRK